MGQTIDQTMAQTKHGSHDDSAEQSLTVTRLLTRKHA